MKQNKKEKTKNKKKIDNDCDTISNLPMFK